MIAFFGEWSPSCDQLGVITSFNFIWVRTLFSDCCKGYQRTYHKWGFSALQAPKILIFPVFSILEYVLPEKMNSNQILNFQNIVNNNCFFIEQKYFSILKHFFCNIFYISIISWLKIHIFLIWFCLFEILQLE
jgi:hypothetical protein